MSFELFRCDNLGHGSDEWEWRVKGSGGQVVKLDSARQSEYQQIQISHTQLQSWPGNFASYSKLAAADFHDKYNRLWWNVEATGTAYGTFSLICMLG